MPVYERPASLGCYEDYSTRVLPFRANAGTVTRGSCISACATANYKFAGVQNGGECWCGNNQPTVKKDGCNVACAGDKSETCGGVWRLDVFSTGRSGGGGTTTPPPPAHSGLAPIASNAATNAQVLTAGPPGASGAKQVWAHHMVGNTYSYKQANWLADINQAKAAGLDGFALNMGRDPWQPQSVAWAYAAAQQAGGFKLFFSFDMTSFGCANDNDANTIANLIKKYATHPAQAYYQNRVLVSTFAGENCNFGKGNVQAGWSVVKSKSGVNYFFIPSTFMTPANIQSQQWFDGQMNWDAAWPNSASDLTLDRDNQWMSALGSRKYMASLSPFFFTYYGPNSWNKNWIYRSDNWLLATRFEQLISIRSKIDMIELITWNDYGESHYIGGIGADQPNSQGWTNNMPHTGLQSLVKFYATAFKTGAYPTPQDKLWLWTRPHPKAAAASKPTNARPNHWEWTDDRLYVVVTLSSPAQVKIESGGNYATWNLQKGLSKLSVASANGVVKASILRNNAVVKKYDSTGKFSYTDKPVDFNFNYFVAEA